MMNIRLNPFYSPDGKGDGGTRPADPVDVSDINEPNPTSHGNKPLTRKEIIQAGGELTPLTREEVYLQKQMKQGGGGGGLPDMTDMPNNALLMARFKGASGMEAEWSSWGFYYPTSADIGKCLVIGDDGDGNPEFDVTDFDDIAEPFIVHFYIDNKNLVMREGWDTIQRHGINVVGFYEPDNIYVPLSALTNNAATFTLLTASTFDDTAMTFAAPVFYRLVASASMVTGGKYTEAGK